MTPPMSSELDRLLTDWMTEGPRRAPEHVTTAAIDHARSHPRRPDPFRALRDDVMPAPGGRSGWALGPALRPVWAVLLVALLVASVAGVAFVGGILRSDPVVVPPDVVATPSPTPSPTPAPTPIVVDIDEAVGADATLTIDDRSGTVVSARTADLVDNATVSEVTFTQLTPTEVEVRWGEGVCETAHDLVIDATGTSFAITTPACEGDAYPRDLAVILEFASEVDATTFTGTLDAS